MTAVEWLIKQIKEDQTIKAKSIDEWNTFGSFTPPIYGKFVM